MCTQNIVQVDVFEVHYSEVNNLKANHEWVHSLFELLQNFPVQKWFIISSERKTCLRRTFPSSISLLRGSCIALTQGSRNSLRVLLSPNSELKRNKVQAKSVDLKFRQDQQKTRRLNRLSLLDSGKMVWIRHLIWSWIVLVGRNSCLAFHRPLKSPLRLIWRTGESGTRWDLV